MLRSLRIVFVVFCVLLASYAVAASTPVTIQPAAGNFGNQYVGKQYSPIAFTVTNTSSSDVSMSAFSFTGPFRWRDGLAPSRLSPGASLTVSAQFWPTTTGPATGQLTLQFTNGLPNVVISLSGTGLATTAAVSYSAKELSFSSTTVGSSTSQNLTVTNTGHSSLSVIGALITPSVFSFSQSFPFTLAPGASKTLSVTYSPVLPGTQHGTMSFTFNSLDFSGVGLTGTANPATALTVATTSPIPGAATRNALYSYALSAAGGTPPYSWSLTSGSLPLGLSLTSQGVVTGTVSKSANNSTFTVRVTDAHFRSATANISLAVEPVATAHCSNISWNITGTSSPEIPMDQLGTGTYLGYEGGLYLSGSNTMPESHLQAGINLADQIVPLDANGNPSSTGKYVLLSLGTSTTYNEFERFLEYADHEPTLNPSLVIVEGAQPNEALDTLLGTSGKDFWNNLYNWSFPEAGVTPEQVVAVWIEPEDAHPPGPFPSDMEQMHTEMRTLIPNLLVRFPNLKILYLSSRAYAGYANPVKVVTEPYSYDQAYALQAVMNDQLNGDPALNFNPAAGPVVAPWLAWADYKWGNGMTAHNGVVWSCADFRSDGYHVFGVGEDKVSGILMNFFKSDPTAAPWFYVPSN